MLNQRLFTFVGGDMGVWHITHMEAVIGDVLESAKRIDIISGQIPETRADFQWSLRGVTSNERYTTRAEKDQLIARQPIIGRPEANCAALIPIRKSAEWWALSQDERRRIFEESSKHVQTGLKVLPAVARRLHHCRDLGTQEPFDFLTWFEFASSNSQAFEEMVAEPRTTEEWKYIDREIDIRVMRE